VVAVEVNLSCPNTESGRHLFAHSAADTAAVVRAVTAVTTPAGRPAWAKLSAGTPELVDVAVAAHEAGAEAVTLVNTVLGMAIDPETRRFRLGAGARGGGLSGPAIHPVAVRATFDVHRARPDLPIVGVGGVAGGADAAELLLAGASAVQVGTATFADPRAPARVRDELTAWAGRQGVGRIAEVTGAVLETG
jgi:dihydroorotate dehydrogenase (NAD+) catalytic subunit